MHLNLSLVDVIWIYPDVYCDEKVHLFVEYSLILNQFVYQNVV